MDDLELIGQILTLIKSNGLSNFIGAGVIYYLYKMDKRIFRIEICMGLSNEKILSKPVAPSASV